MGRPHVVILFALLSIGVAAAPTLQDRVRTATGIQAANVRQAPQGGAPIVGQLRQGEDAELLASLSRWYKVRLINGTEGFVSKQVSDRIAGAPAIQPLATAAPPVTVHFLDVGTGDSAIIDSGTVEIVVDGGNAPTILPNYLRNENLIDGPIELVIVTHGDTDHWKGLNRLMNFDGNANQPVPKVLEFWEPGYDRDCNGNTSARQNYLDFISGMQGLPGILFRRPLQTTRPPATTSGQLQPISIGGLAGVSLTLLHTDQAPSTTGVDCSYQINNASIVFRLDVGGTRFLFTGDANGKERDETNASLTGHVEAKLLALEQKLPGTLRADVIKVPHHGSETASTIPFITAVSPRFVIISSSTTHHLPRSSVVQRYDNGQRVILRTDVQPPSNNDHILCVTAPTLDCNLKVVFDGGTAASSASGIRPGG